MALTDTGCVYSWGYNSDGQLGIGTDIGYDEPKLIKHLSEEFIIDICCGGLHSLVLTGKGDVFAFGDNSCGQCGNDSTANQLLPVKINIRLVIAISCGKWHSIALTINGEVFGWGSNLNGQLSFEWIKVQLYQTLTQLNVPLVKQIKCGNSYTIMLSTDGDIYFCGTIYDCLSLRKSTKINSFSTKFIKIGATIHSDLCVALSRDNMCFIIGRLVNDIIPVNIKELKQTKFRSLDNAFAMHEQITYRTLKTIKYEHCFEEIALLGCGGFSAVFKCEHKFTRRLYAIKKISFEPHSEETVFKELNILSEKSSQFVVNYFNSWVEDNYYLKSVKSSDSLTKILRSPNETQLLHIQMELCSLTLKDAINIVIKECVQNGSTLSLIGYYIASELLCEILECVQYLHSQNPAVIHRDLKPENMLINFTNNRFVKLADFGLSTFHEFDDQSHTKYKGTARYRAPELSYTANYTTKVDIFSLGLITQELFNFTISDTNITCLPVLKQKMDYLVKLVESLLSAVPNKRPNCDHMLSNKQLWLLNDEHILTDAQFNQLLAKPTKLNSIEENFIEYFVHKKYIINKSKQIQVSCSLL